jgi:NADP-dependent 3-hydroxy acid dehydrogenase YdfG
MDISEKHAIVTGTSKGIGLAISKKLIDKGVVVAGFSRSKPVDKELLSSKNFHHISVDLTKEDEVDDAFKSVQELFDDTIHFLINNAGKGYKGPTHEMSSEDWRNLFDLNVHGLFYVTKRVLPLMQKQQFGHVINISSGAGTNGIAEMTAYSASKHAVVGISDSLHKEYRNDGIKVTCLSPGSVDTGFSASNKNKLKPEEMADSVAHILSMPQNFHYTDVQVRPLQP